MKIKITNVYVDDQNKALHFYADVLGFTKKADFSNGPFRWLTVDSPEEAAQVAANHWQTGGKTAVLVCAPVPEEFAMPAAEAERAVAEAVAMADRAGVRGKALTPFLLAQMKDLTAGHTLAANRALLVNNATIAARIAVSLMQG